MKNNPQRAHVGNALFVQPAVGQGTLENAVGTHPPISLAASRGHVNLGMGKRTPLTFAMKRWIEANDDITYHSSMTATLAIDRLSRPEKLRMMEAIWDDLSRNCTETESPVWHKDALADTARKMKAGEIKVLDWGQAKQTLRRRCR